MRKILALLTPFLISIGIFMNVWQSFNYHILEKKAQKLADEQIDLIQNNRLGIMQLTFLKSREGKKSISEIVKDNNLVYPKQSNVINILKAQN